MSVVPSVAEVYVQQNPWTVLGPPGLDSQAASFTALWISDWHFGKVTPQLILSNPFHGHRLSQPAIHPSNQSDCAAIPTCLTFFLCSCPQDHSLPSPYTRIIPVYLQLSYLLLQLSIYKLRFQDSDWLSSSHLQCQSVSYIPSGHHFGPHRKIGPIKKRLYQCKRML